MITNASAFEPTLEQQHELAHSGMLMQLEAIRQWQHTDNLHLKTLLLSAIYTLDATGCDHVVTEEVQRELQEIHNRVSPEVRTKIESILFKQ